MSLKQRQITYFIILGVVGLILGFYIYSMLSPYFKPLKTEDNEEQENTASEEQVKIDFDTPLKIGDEEFNIKISSSPADRRQGLMFLDNLNRDEGMLFVFPSTTSGAFWMKNVNFDLDILFINSQKEVVDIQTMVPCDLPAPRCPRYTSDSPYKYALEINGGLAEEYDLKTGEKVVW